MKTLSLLSLLGVLVLGTLAGSCKTSRPGVKNTLGTYASFVDAEPDKVTEAAKSTLEELDLVLVSATSTKIDGLVEARTANDRTVKVEIESAGENVSKLKIRVGYGDEGLSLRILDGIKSKLGSG